MDTKQECIFNIHQGRLKIISAIRNYLNTCQLTYQEVEERMWDVEAVISMDIDELIGVLSLQEEYKKYLNSINDYC